MASPIAHTLRREIIVLLAVKLAALSVIYFAFFGPSVRPHITTPDIAAHLTAGAANTH